MQRRHVSCRQLANSAGVWHRLHRVTELVFGRARAHAQELDRAHADVARCEHELQRLSRAHRDFLSHFSHDLRTPLTAIIGFAELLQLNDLTPDQADSVGHIVSGGQRMLEMINEVLDLTRIEAGTLTLLLEPVNMGDVVRDAVALVRPLAVTREVELSAEAACGHGVFATADDQRLRQVLSTLLSDGVKDSRHGGRVSVECTVVDERVRILVRDVGAGIPPARLQLLFTPVEKLNVEETGIEGTGLGLVLARRLTEAMGSSIHVETDAERGSVFWIDLPLTEATATSGDARERAAVTPVPEVEGLLLCVEDNVSNVNVLRRLLRHRPGVRLVHADDGETALRLLKREHPDLILLDLHLPDLPGEEVLRRIRAHPVTRLIPVAILSADSDEAQSRRLLAAGAAAYVTKPFNVDQLLGLVDRILGASGRG